MKNSTKIGIGLSIATVASVSVAIMASEKIAKKVYHVANRCKAKKFVNDTFDGNEKLLSIVDKISDDELDSMLDVLGKVKDTGKKMTSYEDSLKDNTENMKDRLFRFFDELV